jgi:hypothetical protein
MAFSAALKLLPLLLLVACESKPAATTTRTVETPTPSLPPPPKAVRDSTQTFTWQDEACTYTGTYAAGAYTQQQLRDTQQLTHDFVATTTVVPFSLPHYTATFFRQAQITLTHEHDSLAQVVHNLHVVPIKFWRKIKQLREAEQAESYALDQAILEGYFHPASWLNNAYSAACPEYAAALASTDTAVVLLAWRKLVDKQKLTNSAPKWLETEFVTLSASPERMAHAKAALMTFGWANCANAQRKYPNIIDHYSLNEQFVKLFKRVHQTDCEEVD